MRDRVEQLDGLRGIFSVLVVAHHHNAFKDSILYNNFFVINSDLFVDFFFVLSGFVIALNYINRINTKEDFFQFIKKRFIRLYPLLFYTEIVFLIFNLLGDFSSFKNSTDLGMDYYLNTVMDTLTFMGSTPVFGSWIGLNYPAWSISAEMISYLVFGLVLLFFPKYKTFTFLALICLSICFIVSNGNYVLAYDYGFIRSLLCFCFGIFTYKFIKDRHYNLTIWEIPFLVVLVGAMYVMHHYGLNLWKLVFPLLFSVGIVIFCNSTGIVTKLLNTAPVQYLGKISYSIYLNHAIVLILVNVVLFRMLKSPETELMFVFSLFTSISITIIYSHFTYKWIEMGVSKFLKARL
ncbi:acyltransferase family protein [Dyadobacter psychrotolerans]|uniref:Acyltransferase n=1 Tax=Dyadobacter psychrotolerans TaxID=2541721 RepID=A0A4R5DYT5_9BACT|nr:acyltransferase [Dyadobacter psychrotolerans]TDE16565.1 acyltransferase [Dyadobacter psychrotolerans]